jgi:hypothetical protein
MKHVFRKTNICTLSVLPVRPGNVPSALGARTTEVSTSPAPEASSRSKIFTAPFVQVCNDQIVQVCNDPNHSIKKLKRKFKKRKHIHIIKFSSYLEDKKNLIFS